MMQGVDHGVAPPGLDDSTRCCSPRQRVRTFATFTMGCRVNQVETERLRHGGVAYGFCPVQPGAVPDLIIINTCAVTSESERQARQLLRRLVNTYPQARLVITGCYAQKNAEQIGQLPGVVLVLGNTEKSQLWEYIGNLPVFTAGASMADNDQVASAADSAPVASTADATVLSGVMQTTQIRAGSVTRRPPLTDLPVVEQFAERSRAFLQVQDGCDSRCTFCTIPLLRGASRSLPTAYIMAQARQYLQAGYREVVLTGINLGAYGRDLAENGDHLEATELAETGFSLHSLHSQRTLATLVAELSRLLTGERLRLSSLDPTDVDAGLLTQFATNPHLCPYLHLSIQSGDDMILKRMGRGYDRALVLEKIKQCRRLRPDMVFGADFIVGFPTETREAFQRTLDLVHEAELTFLHVFRYSDRPDTPAAAIPGRFRVADQESKRRSESLRQAGQTLLANTAHCWLGKRVTVLVETIKDGLAHGKTEGFLPVQFPVTTSLETGQLLSLRLLRFNPVVQECLGEVSEDSDR